MEIYATAASGVRVNKAQRERELMPTYDSNMNKVRGQLEREGQTTSRPWSVAIDLPLRDLFAAFALTGCVREWHDHGRTFAPEAARAAYEYADAMLTQREQALKEK